MPAAEKSEEGQGGRWVREELGGQPGRTLTDDGHHGVEVPDVEALPGHVDEELQHAGPLLLLHHLRQPAASAWAPRGPRPPPPAPEGRCLELPQGPQSCQTRGRWGRGAGCRGRKHSCGVSDAGRRMARGLRGLDELIDCWAQGALHNGSPSQFKASQSDVSGQGGQQLQGPGNGGSLSPLANCQRLGGRST